MCQVTSTTSSKAECKEMADLHNSNNTRDEDVARSSSSDRLTPSEIESLRQEHKQALLQMMQGREHLIV